MQACPIRWDLLHDSIPLRNRMGLRPKGTLPCFGEFHNDIGISEADIIGRIGSNFRLGTAFEGWTDGRPTMSTPMAITGGRSGPPPSTCTGCGRAQAGRVAPFDSHSPAAAMGRAGRFVQPQGEPGSPLAGFGYGLRSIAGAIAR